jgi:hypothetical protein
MTSTPQLAANRQNAARSTGPRTSQGKARSSKNALRHGLRSGLPVLPGERDEDWQHHHDGVVQDLTPLGTLEKALASRVALCLWRMQRVAAYETTVTAAGLEEVDERAEAGASPGHPLFPGEETDADRLQKVLGEVRQKQRDVDLWEGTLRLLETLPGLPENTPVSGDDVEGALQDVNGELPNAENEHFDLEDPDFLTGLGVPRDEQDDAWTWDGWTAGAVRRAIDEMATGSSTSADKVLANAAADRREFQASGKAEVRRLEGEAKTLRKRIAVQWDRERRRRMLPDGATLGKVTRYEAHLSRQMLQALHTLERLQAARAGRPTPPPAVLDVTVSADTSLPEPLEGDNSRLLPAPWPGKGG